MAIMCHIYFHKNTLALLTDAILYLLTYVMQTLSMYLKTVLMACIFQQRFDMFFFYPISTSVYGTSALKILFL